VISSARLLAAALIGCAPKGPASDTDSAPPRPDTGDSAPPDTGDSAPPDTGDSAGEIGDSAPPPPACAEGGPRVLFVGDDGVETDWSATFDAGAEGAPLGVTLSQAGALTICPGDWHVYLRLEADIRVRGEGGRGEVSLDAGGAGPVLHVDGPHVVSAEGLTLRGGLAVHGGGVYATNGASVMLSGLTVKDSRSEDDGHGGGMCLSEGSEAAVEDVIFQGNRASEGGGMAVMNSRAALRSITFEGNRAEGVAIPGYGGGLYVEGGQVTAEDLVIRGNSAAGSGGGLAIWYEAIATFTGGEVTENEAGERGGGAHLLFGQATWLGSIFEGNSAADAGGALALKYSQAALLSATLSGHRARAGAGVDLFASALALSGAVFDDSQASELGGALYLHDDSQAAGVGCGFAGSAPEDVFIDGVGGYAPGASFVCSSAGCW